MAHAPRLTSQQLIERLSQTGRIVTTRTLTDWRDKGLLPKLKTRGKGHGKGQLQYWDDPGIIQQAIILYDMMAIKRRSEFAIWVLWFCGCQVDAVKVQKYWLKSLKKQHLNPSLEPGEFLSDKYTTEIESLARGLAKSQNLPLDKALPIAREIIVATHEAPDIPIDIDEFEVFLLAATFLKGRFDWAKQADIEITKDMLRHLLRVFRSYVSLVALQDTLKLMSVNQLYRSQGYLKVIGSLLRAITLASQQNEFDEFQFLELRRSLAPVFGRMLFELILLIMKSGQEQILRSATPIIAAMETRLLAGRNGPKAPPDLSPQFWKLLNVLSGLSWEKLYNSG